MKKVTVTVRIALIAFLGFSTLGLSSCGNENKAEDPKEIAEESNDEKFDDRDTRQDADFIVEAATINLEEIKLGKLAQEKATLKEVKDLGKMMVMEHEKALSELKALAAQKNVTIPAEVPDEAMDAYNKLSEKSGSDFDKEYSDMMVKGHKKAINKFEKASDNAEDADVRNWASSMLPSLQMHLDHAQKCEELAKNLK